jgi:hypothetical protein
MTACPDLNAIRRDSGSAWCERERIVAMLIPGGRSLRVLVKSNHG